MTFLLIHVCKKSLHVCKITNNMIFFCWNQSNPDHISNCFHIHACKWPFLNRQSHCLLKTLSLWMASYTLRYPKLFWRLSVQCCKFLLVNFVACNHFFFKRYSINSSTVNLFCLICVPVGSVTSSVNPSLLDLSHY